MKNIILICSGGMSSSFLVSKMQSLCNDKNLNINIEAYGTIEAYEKGSNADLILLAPQVSYMHKSLQDKLPNKIIAIIDRLDYGRVNSNKVLEFSLDHLHIKRDSQL